MSDEKIDVQAVVDEAVRKGRYADRKEAIVGLQKQLIDYQRGLLKGTLKEVPAISALEEGMWKGLIEKAGGDEEKAARLYMEELKKLGL
jgi:hypothetical protein